MKVLTFTVFSFLVIFCTIFGSSNTQYQNGRHRSNYNLNATFGNEDLLNKIYDQVVTTFNTDERQLERLVTLGNIIERFEVRNRDQLANIENEIKELGNRIQNLEWIVGRREVQLSQLRNDLDTMRHEFLNQPNSRIGKRDEQSATPTTTPTNIDFSEKLEALATLLTSARSAIHRLEQQTNVITTNITNLLHAAREISQRQYGLATKQYLHSALNSLRSQQSFYGGLYSGRENQYSLSSLPVSCSHVSTTSTGIHKIQIGSTKEPFFAVCNYEVEGGGWIVILNRQDGAINFNRNWLEYKNGFGNLAGEFFIGLDKLHEITSTTLHELLIILEDFEGMQRIARYKLFAIAGEKEDYALRLLGDYEGTAGDSLSYSASYKFSTFDNDNDGWVEGNCALAHTGAWWYNACEQSNLNGQYFGGDIPDSNQFQGVYWNSFHGPKYSLKSAKMLVRPVE